MRGIVPDADPHPDADAHTRASAPCAAPPSGRLVTARTIEFAVLYGALPGVVEWAGLDRFLIPGLILGAIIVSLVLRADPAFDRRRFFNLRGARRALPIMLLTFLIGALALMGLTWHLSTLPDFESRVGLWRLMQERPALLAIICVAYPLASVYPQEVIYRTFFFHRYQCLFRTPGIMIFASAAAFGWGHVIFDNPRVPWDAELSIALTFLGGLLFAWTYHRSRSTVAAWIEHTLFGDWVWIVGLGALFYVGAATM